MREEVETYLDVAAKTKKHIRRQAWNFVGIRNVGNGARVWMYWLMAVVYVIIGVASVMVEHFPGGIKKPWSVCVYDSATHVLEFLLKVAHAWCGSIPRYATALLVVSLGPISR